MIHVRDILYTLPPIEYVYSFRLPSNIGVVKRMGLVISNPASVMSLISPYGINDILSYSLIFNEKDYAIVNKSVAILGMADSVAFNPKEFDSFRFDNVMNIVNANVKNNATHRLIVRTADNLPTITTMFGIGIIVHIKVLFEY